MTTHTMGLFSPTHFYRPSTRASRAFSSASTASDASAWAPAAPSYPSSRSSSQTRSVRSVRTATAVPPPAALAHPFYSSSIDDILCRARAGSTSSLASLSLDSLRAETRPAAFGALEEREERAQFGRAVDVLEPRDTVGFWGMREVLESRSLEDQLIA